MSIELAPHLAAYVKAKNEHDAEAQLACFTPDAVVYDDGEDKELRGTAAIREWIEMVNGQYKLHMDVTAVTESPDETILTALVSGDFPGSPLVFYYHLTVQDGKIASLRVKL